MKTYKCGCGSTYDKNDAISLVALELAETGITYPIDPRWNPRHRRCYLCFLVAQHEEDEAYKEEAEGKAGCPVSHPLDDVFETPYNPVATDNLPF